MRTFALTAADQYVLFGDCHLLRPLADLERVMGCLRLPPRDRRRLRRLANVMWRDTAGEPPGRRRLLLVPTEPDDETEEAIA